MELFDQEPFLKLESSFWWFCFWFLAASLKRNFKHLEIYEKWKNHLKEIGCTKIFKIWYNRVYLDVVCLWFYLDASFWFLGCFCVGTQTKNDWKTVSIASDQGNGNASAFMCGQEHCRKMFTNKFYSWNNIPIYSILK